MAPSLTFSGLPPRPLSAQGDHYSNRTANSPPTRTDNVAGGGMMNSEDAFLNRSSVLFVAVSFILLMFISLAWLVFYYVQRFRYLHSKERASRRLAELARKAVARIPLKLLHAGDKEIGGNGGEHCAICIEPYRPFDNIRILPCRHYFHKVCIDPWLLEQRSCPMCKLDILQAYDFRPDMASCPPSTGGGDDSSSLSPPVSAAAATALLSPSTSQPVASTSTTTSRAGGEPHLPRVTVVSSSLTTVTGPGVGVGIPMLITPSTSSSSYNNLCESPVRRVQGNNSTTPSSRGSLDWFRNLFKRSNSDRAAQVTSASQRLRNKRIHGNHPYFSASSSTQATAGSDDLESGLAATSPHVAMATAQSFHLLPSSPASGDAEDGVTAEVQPRVVVAEAVVTSVETA